MSSPECGTLSPVFDWLHTGVAIYDAASGAVLDANSLIPPEEIAALFSPTVTTNTSHGSGIGLFVMKWCVESLGGEVSFESRDARGNTVCLLLPSKQLPGPTTTD